MKDTEIEIQVKVARTKQLLEFLNAKAKLIGSFRQIDKYYTPKHRNFTKVRPIKEWLRLRKSENGAFITYKNWKYNRSGKSWHCDEYETGFKDIKQMKKLFTVLNFKLLCTVDKTRTIWKYKSYEISLDTVEGLGSFVEIEYKGRKKIKVSEAVNEMVSFLKIQKCGKIQRNNGGYPFMLMFPKEAKFEEL